LILNRIRKPLLSAMLFFYIPDRSRTLSPALEVVKYIMKKYALTQALKMPSYRIEVENGDG